MSEFGENKVQNTSQQAKDDPMEFLAEAMVSNLLTGSPSNAILAQEARGQRQFVASEVLPVRVINYEDYDIDEYMKGLGFVLGDKVEGDDIFRYAKLPQGWQKVATNHSMWSEIHDATGRKRFAIFYKAAFYDRSAHISATPRLTLTAYDHEHCMDPSWGNDEEYYANRGKPGQKFRAVLIDHDRVVAHTEWVEVGGDDEEYYRVTGWVEKAMKRWAEANYPLYRNSTAYWGDEIPVHEEPIKVLDEDKKRY